MTRLSVRSGVIAATADVVGGPMTRRLVSAERLAPVDGIRSFVVGTGGHSLIPFRRPPDKQTELRADDSYGLLALDLLDGAYRWKFVPIPGDELNDAGTATCH